MPDDAVPFPKSDWDALYELAHKRYSTYIARNDLCDLMNLIVNSYSPDGSDIPWQIAAHSIPGFQESLGSFLHRLTHFAFEIGRQYEINHRALSFEDITPADFKKE